VVPDALQQVMQYKEQEEWVEVMEEDIPNR
jgi:hypothetical protein